MSAVAKSTGGRVSLRVSGLVNRILLGEGIPFGGWAYGGDRSL